MRKAAFIEKLLPVLGQSDHSIARSVTDRYEMFGLWYQRPRPAHSSAYRLYNSRNHRTPPQTRRQDG